MLIEARRKGEIPKGGVHFHKNSTPTQKVGVQKTSLSDMGLSFKESARAQRLVKVTEAKPELREAVLSGRITAGEAVKPHPHISQNSGDNEWYTPAEFIEAARAAMGGIDLDPASSSAANEIVKAARFYSIQDDGLTREWGGRVWMNPPYSSPHITLFVAKLLKEIGSGRVTQAVVLVHNCTDTQWFRDLAGVFETVCFKTGRVRHWKAEDAAPEGGALQGSLFAYYGGNGKEFIRRFGSFGVTMRVQR